MFKYFQLFLVLSLVLFAGCVKENEVNKPVQTIAGQGIILNKQHTKVELPTASITQTKVIDTKTFESQQFVKQEINISAEEKDIEQIEVGDIMLSKNDKGQLIPVLVYEINKASPNRNGRVIAVIVKGIQTTLDLYYSQENARETFVTTANRAKKNTDIANKVEGTPLQWLPAEVKFENELGKSAITFEPKPDKLFSASIETTLWKDGESYIKTKGKLSIQPALDFYIKYEPQKVKKNTPKWKKVLDWSITVAAPDVILLGFKNKEYWIGGLQQVKTNFYLDVDVELAFELHLEKEVDKTITVEIGKVIIPKGVVHTEFELAFEIDLSAAGSLDFTMTHKEFYDLVLGLDYTPDDTKWFKDFKNEDKTEYNLEAKVKLGAGISLIARTEVYLLSVLGPEFIGKPFVEAEAVIAAQAGNTAGNRNSIDWSMKADVGLKGQAKLNLSGLGVDLLTLPILDSEEQEIDRLTVFEAPQSIKIISGDGQNGVISETLPQSITIGAYDSRDKLITYLPVAIYVDPRPRHHDR